MSEDYRSETFESPSRVSANLKPLMVWVGQVIRYFENLETKTELGILLRSEFLTLKLLRDKTTSDIS